MFDEEVLRTADTSSSPLLGSKQTEALVADFCSSLGDKARNIILYGSLPRGEPFNDVDCRVIRGTLEGSEAFMGRDINTYQMTLPELERELAVSLRMLASTFDSVLVNSQVDLQEVFSRGKGSLTEERRAIECILFSISEQQRERRAFAKLANRKSGYYLRKKQPGSKRTIMHLMHIFRLSFPSLFRNNNTLEGLQSLRVAKVLPDSVYEAVLKVFSHINTDDDNELQSGSGIISIFFNKLAEHLLREVQSNQHFTPEYLNKLNLILNEEASDGELLSIVDYAETATLPEYSRWNLIHMVSGSQAVTDTVSGRLRETYQGDHAYRHIVRNLKKRDLGL